MAALIVGILEGEGLKLKLIINFIFFLAFYFIF